MFFEIYNLNYFFVLLKCLTQPCMNVTGNSISSAKISTKFQFKYDVFDESKKNKICR